MVGQQVSMQEMQLLQEFHARAPRSPTRWLHIAAISSLFLSGIWLLSACGAPAASQRLDSRTLAQANTILDEIARAELALSPETASRSGIENLAGENATSLLDDHSQAGFERKRLIELDLLALVRSRPVMPTDHPVGRDLLIVEDALLRLTQVQTIGHGRYGLSFARPYAIDPYSGVWIDGPNLLETEHRIANRTDAIAYLARLQALPDAIDDTRRRLIADAESGVTPPAALVIDTRRAIDTLRNPETGRLDRLARVYSNVLQSLPDMAPAELESLTEQAAATVEEQLRPAYSRLSNTLLEISDSAPVQGGLWAQPDGHITYTRLLEWYIGEAQVLDDLHQANIDAVATRARAFQNKVTELALEPGTLQDQLAALIAQDEIDSNAAEVTEPVAVQNQTAPPLVAASFTGYDYVAPRLDGQRPAQAYRQPIQSARWPRYMQAALQLEQDIALRQPFANMGTQRRSPARALASYPGLRDAWQYYTAEAYGNQHITLPIEQLGQSQLFLLNAAMAAADTGMHHKRWSLDQTTAYLVDKTHLPEPLMREATLRIAARPGRAAARVVGYRRITSLATRARAVLGARYDETSFESVLLTDGPRPFDLIEQDVEAWYQDQLPSAN